jgi:hypothetical protein
MGVNLIEPAQMSGGQQQMMPQQMSGLAAALMGQGGGIPMGGGGGKSMGGMDMSMLAKMLMSDNKAGQNRADEIWSGLGNWLNGYQWDGMAGGGMLDALSQSAAGNAAGGGGGL